MPEQKQLHVRIDEEIYRKLKVKCIYQGISVQDYIARLIEASLGQNPDIECSVLIVEDESIVRESLRDWLKDNYQVTTAETGEEALELIRENDYDIMIIDVRLPGKSGLQVLSEVKEAKPYIGCIVVTAYPAVELAVEAMKLGAVDYLVKPVILEQLEQLMTDILLKRKTGTAKKISETEGE